MVLNSDTVLMRLRFLHYLALVVRVVGSVVCGLVLIRDRHPFLGYYLLGFAVVSFGILVRDQRRGY